MKKLISLILSLTMLLTLTAGLELSVCALTSGDYDYSLVNGTAEIKDYLGSATTLTIPSALNGYTVTSIGNNAFQKCTTLTSVTIPNSVTTINGSAFSSCTSLESITIPDSVTTLGSEVFYNCTALTSAAVGGGITSLPSGLFKNCTSLTSVSISENVTSMGDSVFNYCTALTSITIPSNVTSIGKYAFYSCKSLTSITLPESVASVGDYAFGGFCTSLTSISFLNPNCEIYDRGGTISTTATIYGYANSTAYSFAAKYGFNFRCFNHTYTNVVTKATLSKNGKITPTCSVCGATDTAATIYYPKTIKLSSTSYTYDGKVHKTSVTIKDSNGNKVSSEYYTVTYSNSNSKSIGSYTVTIKFKGNYSGTKTLIYTIKPKSTSISKVTAKSKGFTVKWKKQSTQTTGYQIQYSTSSKFSSAKTATVTKNSTTSKTIKSLKSKKTYYVRVRTYKTVNGKKVYSNWSTAKKVKTK